MKKQRQVFLLYETVPSDPYEPDRLESVHETMEGAQREVREHPLHPWGRVQEDGSVEAKPIGTPWTFGAKIVPVDLKP